MQAQAPQMARGVAAQGGSRGAGAGAVGAWARRADPSTPACLALLLLLLLLMPSAKAGGRGRLRSPGHCSGFAQGVQPVAGLPQVPAPQPAHCTEAAGVPLA